MLSITIDLLPESFVTLVYFEFGMPRIKRKRESLESEGFECEICLEKHPHEEAISAKSCNKHWFCRDSLAQYIKTQLDSTCIKIRCPCFKCECYFLEDEIKSLAAKKDFKRYKRFQAMKRNPNYRECPKCFSSTLAGDECNMDITCENCSHKFCFLHENAHKIGKRSYCINYTNKVHDKDEKRSKLKIAKTTRKCPSANCVYRIERNGGCPIMKCFCGFKFVWDQYENIPYRG